MEHQKYYSLKYEEEYYVLKYTVCNRQYYLEQKITNVIYIKENDSKFRACSRPESKERQKFFVERVVGSHKARYVHLFARSGARLRLDRSVTSYIIPRFSNLLRNYRERERKRWKV